MKHKLKTEYFLLAKGNQAAIDAHLKAVEVQYNINFLDYYFNYYMKKYFTYLNIDSISTRWFV